MEILYPEIIIGIIGGIIVYFINSAFNYPMNAVERYFIPFKRNKDEKFSRMLIGGFSLISLVIFSIIDALKNEQYILFLYLFFTYMSIVVTVIFFGKVDYIIKGQIKYISKEKYTRLSIHKSENFQKGGVVVFVILTAIGTFLTMQLLSLIGINIKDNKLMLEVSEIGKSIFLTSALIEIFILSALIIGATYEALRLFNLPLVKIHINQNDSCINQGSSSIEAYILGECSDGNDYYIIKIKANENMNNEAILLRKDDVIRFDVIT